MGRVSRWRKGCGLGEISPDPTFISGLLVSSRTASATPTSTGHALVSRRKGHGSVSPALKRTCLSLVVGARHSRHEKFRVFVTRRDYTSRDRQFQTGRALERSRTFGNTHRDTATTTHTNARHMAATWESQRNNRDYLRTPATVRNSPRLSFPCLLLRRSWSIVLFSWSTLKAGR